MQHGVGNARNLRHFGDVVDAYDVRTKEDAGSNGGRGTPNALIEWRRLAVFASVAPRKPLRDVPTSKG